MDWNNWDESNPVQNITLFLYDSVNDHFAHGRFVLTEEDETMEVFGLTDLMPPDFCTTHWAYPIRPHFKKDV